MQATVLYLCSLLLLLSVGCFVGRLWLVFVAVFVLFLFIINVIAVVAVATNRHNSNV